MSEFITKVQINGENKLIGLDENAIDAGLKLQDDKVALNVTKDAGLAFNGWGELMLMLGSGINTQDGIVQVNIYNESSPSGLAFDPNNRNLCVDLDANGGMERGVNGLKLKLDHYGGLHAQPDGLRLALDTDGIYATGLEVGRFQIGGGEQYYHLPCVKLKPNGGLALSTDGLHVDTGTLFAEIARYFGLTPKT